MKSWELGEFYGKHVVFVGAGKGRALEGTKTFIEKHGQIASFEAVDKRPGDQPLAFLIDYDKDQTIFIKNEGIPGSEMPVPYVTQLQLFFRLVSNTGARTVGITGTKGKSTTASLTHHILQTAGIKSVLAGNIGVSPLLALDEAESDTVFVLELSSYQLSDLKTSPLISACLNLYNDHSDWHGSIENYWEAKHNIMRFAPPEGLFIYNPDFPLLNEWASAATSRVKAINKNESLDLSKSALYGEHNRLNGLVARDISRELGVDDSITQRAIDSFQPLEHRMELVASVNKRTYIDDAIGMTPESTMASLTAVENKFGQIGCLLLGGQDRNYDFSNLLKQIASMKIPNLVLFPDTVSKIRFVIPPDYTPDILETKDMREAVDWASEKAPENSVILLSSAAPSYSLWSGFEEKGDLFKKSVSSLSS
jgi:UDP-N-acetylmuramoylalanine--D-glutamate ligase